MITALVWGAVAASSLLLGALLGLVRPWPTRLIGAMLAFGAGALISAVSFDLAEAGAAMAGGLPVGLGLGVGASTYFLSSRWLNRRGPSPQSASGPGGGTAVSAGAGAAPLPAATGSGVGLALGAFLDGIPEQAVLGIGMSLGGGVSVGLLTAIFISNLPEAIGSASEMIASGVSRIRVLWLWCAITAICAMATPAGFALADVASQEVQAALNGFAAGALLVMLVDEMIPQARAKAGDSAGLLTVLGFAVGAGLSVVSR